MEFNLNNINSSWITNNSDINNNILCFSGYSSGLALNISFNDDNNDYNFIFDGDFSGMLCIKVFVCNSNFWIVLNLFVYWLECVIRNTINRRIYTNR